MFDEKMSALAWANTKQSFIKHFLTEADRIAVGAISPLSDQGGYAVAMNYGELTIRTHPLCPTLVTHPTIADTRRVVDRANCFSAYRRDAPSPFLLGPVWTRQRPLDLIHHPYILSPPPSSSIISPSSPSSCPFRPPSEKIPLDLRSVHPANIPLFLHSALIAQRCPRGLSHRHGHSATNDYPDKMDDRLVWSVCSRSFRFQRGSADGNGTDKRQLRRYGSEDIIRLPPRKDASRYGCASIIAKICSDHHFRDLRKCVA